LRRSQRNYFPASPLDFLRILQQRRRCASATTLDELGTGWLDCGSLAQMPSLHNFHEMGACAPDLVGVNFLPGGQLYGDESGPRWPIYHSLPLCGMTIDGRSYDAASCRCLLSGRPACTSRQSRSGHHKQAGHGRHGSSVAGEVHYHGATPKTFDVALTADIGWMPVNREIIGPGEIRATSDKGRWTLCIGSLISPNKADGPVCRVRVSIARMKVTKSGS